MSIREVSVLERWAASFGLSLFRVRVVCVKELSVLERFVLERCLY